MATTITWDIRENGQALLAGLGQRLGFDLGAELADITRQLPSMGSFRPMQEACFVRLHGHQRAFYKTLKPSGVLAFKGTELKVGDLDRAFKELSDEKLSNRRSLLEHFIISEQKIPMALLHEEALAEATNAHDFQQAYFARYREIARVPLSLLVFRWSDEDAAVFERRLVPLLSRRAEAIARNLLESGLGVYVYYYPELPERLAQQHLTAAGACVDHRGFQARYDALAKRREPKQVIDDWVRLFARMLGLGYLPCNLVNIGIGQCVDPNNAILDGGFADLDSLQRIADIPDNARFYETFAYSLASLAGVVQGFLVGGTKLQFHSGMDPLSSLPIHVVCVKLGRMIEEDHANGAQFDPRILGFFASEDPLESLIILCREILPPLEVASHA
jgi:hypothetical protein